MARHRDEDIPIAKLILDPNNSRHRFQNSQREILHWMTHGTGRIGQKLLTLAKDIVVYGLNPAERVMVIPDASNPAEYTVIEGNRRITAVKLLNRPDIAPTQDSKQRFKKIRGSHFSPIKSCPVQCSHL